MELDLDLLRGLVAAGVITRAAGRAVLQSPLRSDCEPTVPQGEDRSYPLSLKKSMKALSAGRIWRRLG
jgi:hypothetical protein